MRLALFFIKIFLLNLSLLHECTCSNTVDVLKELSSISSPSGFEDDMRNFLIKKWKGICREVHTDSLGNVFFCLNCSVLDRTKPIVVVCVHMDEVGLIVKSITDDGFIRFEPLGGWLEIATILQKWIIKTPKGNVVGVSGFESAHVCNKYPSVPVKPMNKMFIDIGVKTKKEAEDMGIRPGLGIAPYPTFEIIGANSTRILAKALDDRIGLAVLNGVMNALKGKSLDVNLIVVCTVQEEVGMRGAKAIAGTIKPDIFISIDTSMSADFPLQVADPDGSGTKLGSGFSFFVFDGSMIPDQKLLEYFINFANENNMKYQYDAMPLYGHDASSLQQCFNGVATINIGIPCRYTHSGNSIIDLEDAENTEKFLIALLSKIKKADIERIIDKR
jgi:putative aminopeptidase FrvX